MPQAQKRILFVVYELPPLGGGVARAASQLLREFSNQKNLQIDVVTSSVQNEWGSTEFSKNITLYSVPIGDKPPESYHSQTVDNMLRFTLNSTKQIYTLLKHNNYSVAHYFGYPSALPGWLFKHTVPYIISLRGVDVPGYNLKFGWYYKVYKPLSKLLWKSAQRVFVNSQKLQALAQQTLQRTYQVIPNGVDTELFQPVPDNKKHPTFTVTAGGTIMGPKKGLQYLIEGFAAFHAKHADSQLVLFGAGDLEEQLRALVAQLQLEQVVVFKGMVTADELAAKLPKCHVFCLPSLAEGMSNANLEALACGLPIVITPVGGSDELLANENGVLIEMGSPDRIAEALEGLNVNNKQRMEMGRKSRELALAYSWEQAARKYREVWNN